MPLAEANIILQEFAYGFYDGISGLVTQPMRGAEKEGAVGLVKGIGKGIGGLILKPGAGTISPCRSPLLSWLMILQQYGVFLATLLWESTKK